MELFKRKSTIFLVITYCLFSCSQKPKNIPHYNITKVFKTDTATTIDVRIASRMKLSDLLLIAGKIKADSAKLNNLAIHYLLPGNSDFTSGDNSYFAQARYVKDNDIKTTDTLKDDNGRLLRLNIFGVDSAKAQQLLAVQPVVITGKTVLGRFVDDNSKTLIIPFKDPTDKKDELFVIEVNANGDIVSATVPQKKVEDGKEEWMVDKNGDYMTIKDGVLSQYSSEGLGLPFNSIKSGI